MPGLVGFIGPMLADEQRPLLQKMARALEVEPRFRVEAHQEEGVGLARVTLGIVNGGPQPHWNEEQTICILLEGELFDTAVLRQQLQQQNHPCRADHDAELILRRYEAYGEAFADPLNGSFLIAIWDRSRQKLIVANDRMGQYPVYYARHGDRLLFASGVRALLADPDVPRDVDRAAIAQFLTFDHLLDDRTLLQAAHLLPQATLLIVEGGDIRFQRYWTLHYPEQIELLPESHYIETFTDLFRQAIRRQSTGSPLGVLLSGGLDSRLILAELAQATPQTLHTFTWGIPGCDDGRYAANMARQIGTRHHFFPLRSDFLLDMADNAVRITDGQGNIVNLHALATLEEETQHAQIIYKGFLGDAMMGFALQPPFWTDYDEATRIKAHLAVHHGQGVITFDPFTEHEGLFSQAFREGVGTAVLDSYAAGMAAGDNRSLALQRLYFDLTQRVPRMTLNGVEVARHRALVRLPFADNDLVQFSTIIPPGLQYERRVARKAFVNAFPQLAQIPLTDTGLPLVACLREVQIRAARLARWQLHNRGLGPHPDSLRKPYKDYNNWFRTILRSWIEDTLLSPRHLQRGYYNPDAIRQVVADHMAGQNQTVRLGALLAIELWHRQFID
jgi:asparagine synthase (glutamine-hydrolysing)